MFALIGSLPDILKWLSTAHPDLVVATQLLTQAPTYLSGIVVELYLYRAATPNRWLGGVYANGWFGSLRGWRYLFKPTYQLVIRIARVWDQSPPPANNNSSVDFRPRLKLVLPSRVSFGTISDLINKHCTGYHDLTTSKSVLASISPVFSRSAVISLEDLYDPDDVAEPLPLYSPNHNNDNSNNNNSSSRNAGLVSPPYPT
ncbi:hypothetical protein EV182_005464 [Spiromyces aspiralis]|uniref:Uncharacterized protein n=1 Tax=Spiromyces aspiralis TaxID=68401 RepID=A0ACC1HG64_9FUNG|nr:hypothetical protein EV182_005464 [Spiromyces aspiralis]